MRRTITTIAAVAGLALAGCGSSSSTTRTSPPSARTATNAQKVSLCTNLVSQLSTTGSAMGELGTAMQSYSGDPTTISDVTGRAIAANATVVSTLTQLRGSVTPGQQVTIDSATGVLNQYGVALHTVAGGDLATGLGQLTGLSDQLSPLLRQVATICGS